MEQEREVKRCGEMWSCSWSRSSSGSRSRSWRCRWMKPGWVGIMLGVSLGKYEWMLFACRLSVPPFTPLPSLSLPLSSLAEKILMNWLQFYLWLLVLFASLCCLCRWLCSGMLQSRRYNFYRTQLVLSRAQSDVPKAIPLWRAAQLILALCILRKQCTMPRPSTPSSQLLSDAKLIIGHQPNWPDLQLVTADASSDYAGINSASAWRGVYVFARNCVSSLSWGSKIYMLAKRKLTTATVASHNNNAR